MEAEDLEMTEGSSFVWHPKACLKKPYKEWRNPDPFHVNHEPNSFLRPTFLIMKPRMIAKLRSVCLSDSFEFANNHTTLRMIELKKRGRWTKKRLAGAVQGSGAPADTFARSRAWALAVAEAVAAARSRARAAAARRPAASAAGHATTASGAAVPAAAAVAVVAALTRRHLNLDAGAAQTPVET